MNKTVVITGAAGVLCGVIAEDFARRGANVALLDLNGDAARQKAEGLTAGGFVAGGFAADVLSKESLESALERVRARFGECDVLINGAGGNHPSATTDAEFYSPEKEESAKSFFDLTEKGVDFVFDLNFKGTFLTTQVFARGMAERGKGNIINISSMNAYKPLTKIPAYSAAKAAVSNFTQWLAVHFAKSGIRVNAIAPGFFVTNQNKGLLYGENGQPTARADKILRNTPMGRFGEPEELLGAVRFLTDDGESGFITGIVLPIDGGFSAYSGV
ncbi:MAG: SDR family oxidoreductase [Clostridiales bacterium]|jgi:NAD(P)-dependent dehydrogenase (short-subunit alcohol dehydrogenase family)|nr:SDR family oxidoreductase [Clostridiales bacterium]